LKSWDLAAFKSTGYKYTVIIQNRAPKKTYMCAFIVGPDGLKKNCVKSVSLEVAEIKSASQHKKKLVWWKGVIH